MTPRSYASPAAFKQALEQRLRDASPSGGDLARQRQLLVFDRFLARVVAAFGDAVTLKGGLALELRIDQARTTKDIDLRLMSAPDDLLSRVQEAGRLDLGDFMAFEVRPDTEHPEIRNDGMRYDGLRLRGECRLAARIYGRPFGIDVAFGDPVLGEPSIVIADDTLGFAGITPPKLRLYPVESHVAEKLHAYTMPRPRPNSRVKDLPDLALLATVANTDTRHLRRAIEQTFSFRATHAAPARLPEPPTAWTAPYARMATESGLRWRTLIDVTAAASAFLDPALAGELDARWDPARWCWTSRAPEST